MQESADVDNTGEALQVMGFTGKFSGNFAVQAAPAHEMGGRRQNMRCS